MALGKKVADWLKKLNAKHSVEKQMLRRNFGKSVGISSITGK